jgi:pyridoxal phosphate enzyme (YggS family)
MSIKQNVQQILNELPEGVQLVAASKTRTPAEILEAVAAGVQLIGENYIQEAEKAYEVVGNRATWHFIGHLQRNKVKKAVRIFDMIETVDSREIAREIDKRCAEIGKVMPVLIEVNIGEEPQKAGALPEDTGQLIRDISALPNIRVMGLMTMGPLSENPEDSRPYFVAMKKLFDRMKESGLPNVEMKYLSMGMTSSYQIAPEEGANIVRVGTRIFGERKYP